MHPVLRNRGPSGKCKFKGRVAPECAAGEISEMLVRFRSLAHTEVLLACRDLPPEDRDKVLSDFEKAMSHLIYVLELKLCHWLSNPYRLLAIGHPDVSVARTTCQAAFALAQSLTSDAERNEQHRLVKLMCFGPGQLYMEFRQFLEGAELAELPVLMHIRARAKLVSVIEREIEWRHQVSGRAAALVTNANGAYISVAHREPEVEAYINMDPANLLRFCEAVEKVRSGHYLLTSMGLHYLPRIIQLMDQITTASTPTVDDVFISKRFWGLIDAVVYHTDPWSSYRL